MGSVGSVSYLRHNDSDDGAEYGYGIRISVHILEIVHRRFDDKLRMGETDGNTLSKFN